MQHRFGVKKTRCGFAFPAVAFLAVSRVRPCASPAAIEAARRSKLGGGRIKRRKCLQKLVGSPGRAVLLGRTAGTASQRRPFCASMRPVSPRRSADVCKWLCAKVLLRLCAAAARGCKIVTPPGAQPLSPFSRRPALGARGRAVSSPATPRQRQFVAKRDGAVQ